MLQAQPDQLALSLFENSGKVWTALDPERRASRRQKELADTARLLKSYPQWRVQIPPAILDRRL